MSTVQPSAQVPQNRQRVKLQTTPEGREALRDVLSWAIRNNGEIDPVLLQRVMAHGLLKQAILNAVVVVRDRDRKKKGEREKKMRQQQQSNASNSGDGQAALQMNPQLDTIKAAHCKKLVALRNEAHRSSQSFVANEDLTKARTETMASINALNCAFVRFVGDNNFLIIQPAEKEAEKMYNSGQTVQCRWKENTNVSCEKTQKDLQKSALMDALNSAKVKHCEGPGGNVTFELEIKSEVIRRMKQLLGEAEFNEILQKRINHVRHVYDSAIRKHVSSNTDKGFLIPMVYPIRTLQDAVSLGIDKKWLNEQAQKAVDKRIDEIRLQKEQEEREKNKALAKVNGTMTLLQNSSEGERLIETFPYKYLEEYTDNN